jgi:peptidoglycan/LPS O-acetylase OafA/YrhL
LSIGHNRLAYLHAIRGWAALFVVIAHAKYPFWSGGQAYIDKYPVSGWDWSQYLLFALAMSTSFASVFVITFFVLSGFFIARSLNEKKYSPLFFYGDRVIRIYIPYAGSLLVGYFAMTLANVVNPDLFGLANPEWPYNRALIAAYQDVGWTSLTNAILFLPGESEQFFGMNYPYWSLFFEALFYLVIPFVFLLLRKYWFFGIAFFLHVLSFFISTEWLSVTAFLLKYSLYFAAGVFLYEFSSGRPSRVYLLKYTRKMTNSMIFASLFFIAASIPLGLMHFKKFGYISGMVGTMLLMIWLLYGRRSAVYNFSKKMLINPLSEFLGKISFSMYLIHVPLLALMYTYWTGVSGKLVFYEFLYWIPVLLIIPMGYLFYLLFERSSLILLGKYKQRFRR